MFSMKMAQRLSNSTDKFLQEKRPGEMVMLALEK